MRVFKSFKRTAERERERVRKGIREESSIFWDIILCSLLKFNRASIFRTEE
jgi:hypothetical protein